MKHEGVTDFFYIMGAPMLGVEKACMTLGLRGIDVRHEQAAAMAGFAYSRLLNRPSFCMAASGPGVTNLLTGIAHAWADCTPVIALGGAAPVATWHRGAFQDIDQLAIFKPCTKWSDRVHHVRRIPELIHLAVTQAMTGKPGRDLGYPRLDKFSEAFGGHGEYVTKPDDIRPALERAKKAVAEGKPALVCVVTDHNARATTAAFTNYST
jgi:thiamine pyrophosphate-dependent acetolactate synthase large subunit-like protein